MKELSLHILDIAKNSTAAGATLVEIIIDEDAENDLLSIIIKDNGKGMSDELLAKVRDPFTTSRSTREVGMGIPLFELAAVQSGGRLEIESEVGKGTTVSALFELSNIDRQPLGDIASTVVTLIQGSPQIDFVYRHTAAEGDFELDTRQIKEVLQGVPISEPDVLNWLAEHLSEGINNIGGNLL